MEKKMNTAEKRPYVRPEAELHSLRLQENIATSQPEKIKLYIDEFDGEDDVFE